MPRLSPQFRFLLRGSCLLIALLALWWWALLPPMLDGIRAATRAVLWLMPGGRTASGVTVQNDGSWMIQAPLPQWLARQDAVQRAYGRAPGGPPVRVRSFKLIIFERIPTFFTLGFPLFWALMLAAPPMKGWWRGLLGGSAILAALGVAGLLIYTAYSIESNLKLVSSPWAVTLWDSVEYLNINVAPYVAPLVLALWLHAELRARVFFRDALPEPAPAAQRLAPKPTRGRYRAS